MTENQGIIYIVSSSSITLTNWTILNHQSTSYFCIAESSSLTLIKCAIDCDLNAYITQGSGPNNYNTNQVGKSSFINTMPLLDYQSCLNPNFYKVQNKVCISGKFGNYNYMSTSYASVLITT